MLVITTLPTSTTTTTTNTNTNTNTDTNDNNAPGHRRPALRWWTSGSASAARRPRRRAHGKARLRSAFVFQLYFLLGVCFIMLFQRKANRT